MGLRLYTEIYFEKLFNSYHKKLVFSYLNFREFFTTYINENKFIYKDFNIDLNKLEIEKIYYNTYLRILDLNEVNNLKEFLLNNQKIYSLQKKYINEKKSYHFLKTISNIFYNEVFIEISYSLLKEILPLAINLESLKKEWYAVQKETIINIIIGIFQNSYYKYNTNIMLVLFRSLIENVYVLECKENFNERAKLPNLNKCINTFLEQHIENNSASFSFIENDDKEKYPLYNCLNKQIHDMNYIEEININQYSKKYNGYIYFNTNLNNALAWLYLCSINLLNKKKIIKKGYYNILKELLPLGFVNNIYNK